MRVALDEFELDEALAAQLWDYLVMAAHSLVNADPCARAPGPRAEACPTMEPASAPEDIPVGRGGGGSDPARDRSRGSGPLGQVCTARWPVTS